jgi:ubiquinone/menaquinone biosynthesis C-methylase UbiE
MNIKTQYDVIGKDYYKIQETFFSKIRDSSIDVIKSFLPNLSGKRVLDLGCGYGRAIKLYESMGAKDVFGVDTSRSLIEECKKYVTKPQNLFVRDMEKLSFKNNYFDVVVGRFSLHYLKNFKSAYKEISRVLKKNGQLVLIVHHPIYDLLRKGNKIYNKQELIVGKLFDNKVQIVFPSHTLTDYFSKDLFEYFYLCGFVEEKCLEEYNHNGYITPTFMGFKAIKK